MKTPSVKDVLDFDNPDVSSPKQPPHEESKLVEPERLVMIKSHCYINTIRQTQYCFFSLIRKTPDEVEPTGPQGRETQDGGKAQLRSSKPGDASDWAPYAGEHGLRVITRF